MKVLFVSLLLLLLLPVSAHAVIITDLDISAGTGVYSNVVCLSSTDCKVAYSDNAAGDLDITFIDCDSSDCATSTVSDVDASSSASAPTLSLSCPSSDNCKLVYFNPSASTLTFIDCDSSACSTFTSTTLASSVSANTTMSLACPASDNCKLAYISSSSLKFVDCDSESCSSYSVTILDSNVGTSSSGTSIFCLNSSDCQVSYHDSADADLSLVDCGNEACSSSVITDLDVNVGSAAPNSIYCPSAVDCKLLYIDGSHADLTFIDCNTASCLAPAIVDLDTAVGTTGWVSDKSLDCAPGAVDCRLVYYDGPAQDITYIDCNSATCSSSIVTDLDINTGLSSAVSAIACPSSTTCKVVYFDGTDSDLTFVSSM